MCARSQPNQGKWRATAGRSGACLIGAVAAAAPAAAQTTMFDFNNAPQYTPLPIDLTVGGITAHFSATGQGYSIQSAGAMGFTPAGFSGNCIFPSSVFAADLLVGFSQAMTDFSIMYSPQELGCDDSATMTVTAYIDSQFEGTNTTTAEPPGTWPTGTLTFSSVQAFNRVVVHYDARPPTCGDWGPIFLADNMSVTPSPCTGASVVQQPSAASACRTGSAGFGVTAAGTGPMTYQWQRETIPNSGIFVLLTDGPTASWDGGGAGVGATVSGSSTASLTIAADTAHNRGLSAAHAVRYRCTVTNACGGASSAGAQLSVCTPDFNCDGAANSQDFFDFLNGFFASASGADFNGDGAVNSQDFFDFLNAFFAGC